ncbi:MAG: hypothetical protein H7Y10_03685 [Flavobacterium sp.]|nr:hypothetical protein [Flavobacterium sp.]
MAKKTITYSENTKGWTSFFSYEPDMLCKLNNRFFSIKDGQLWMHNDESNPVMNNFYGVQYSSKIDTIFNQDNSEDKIFKTMVLEGNQPWDVAVKTNLANSTIKNTEFNQRESRQFAYLRKNEDSNDLHGNTAQGIGVITGVTTVGTVRTITYNTIPNFVSIGDKLYQLNGNVQEYLGTIDSIDFKNGKVTVQIPPSPRKHSSKFNLKFN